MWLEPVSGAAARRNSKDLRGILGRVGRSTMVWEDSLHDAERHQQHTDRAGDMPIHWEASGRSHEDPSEPDTAAAQANAEAGHEVGARPWNGEDGQHWRSACCRVQQTAEARSTSEKAEDKADGVAQGLRHIQVNGLEVPTDW